MRMTKRRIRMETILGKRGFTKYELMCFSRWDRAQCDIHGCRLRFMGDTVFCPMCVDPEIMRQHAIEDIVGPLDC